MILSTKIREKIRDLPPGWIILFLVDSLLYSEFNLALLKHLIDDLNLQGLYVTIGKPYLHLVKELNREGVDVNKLIFIDGISKQVSQKVEKVDGCVFISSPNDLTSIGIALTESIAQIKKRSPEPFVFLDSLSTLLIHNTAELVGRFSHFTVARMRVWEAKGVIMSLEEDADLEVVRRLATFCDETINVSQRAMS